MKIAGSTALVTGANRGLGACLVTELLDAGADKIYAAVRRPDALEPLAANPRVHGLVVDITDQASVDAAAERARDVTVLVNNAGVLGFGGVLEGDLDVFARDLTVNCLGTLRMTRAFVPVLADNAPAAIVNVLSMVSIGPLPGMAGYSASKAASHSMTQSLRKDLRGSGIEVIGAYPDFIDTGMVGGLEITKVGPADMARRIVARIIADETEFWLPATG
jgi:NAD(P)-dependent dehydrogenase (short-subunit alcohol dehydrogenase family)